MLLMRARRRFRTLYTHLNRGEDLPPLDRDVHGAPPNDRHTPGSSSACETIDETLPLYARGDLPHETFSQITNHLTECTDCRHALLAEQAMNRLIQRSLVLAFTIPFSTMPAAWHASMVLNKERPRPSKGELDGSTQILGIVQVNEVSHVREVVQVRKVRRQDWR